MALGNRVTKTIYEIIESCVSVGLVSSYFAYRVISTNQIPSPLEMATVAMSAVWCTDFVFYAIEEGFQIMRDRNRPNTELLRVFRSYIPHLLAPENRVETVFEIIDSVVTASLAYLVTAGIASAGNIIAPEDIVVGIKNLAGQIKSVDDFTEPIYRHYEGWLVGMDTLKNKVYWDIVKPAMSLELFQAFAIPLLSRAFNFANRHTARRY